MKATLTDPLILEEEGSVHDLVELARKNEGKISIGRSRDNIIVIGEGTFAEGTFARSAYTNAVSREHGTITVDLEKETVDFTDDSSFGTEVRRDGERDMYVRRGETVRLQNGDDLYLGHDGVDEAMKYGPLWVKIE